MAKQIPAPLKDLAVLVVVFSVILGGLYLYAGVWPPAVIVESGSMMHRDDDVSYGRVGTIDPGDMVLVKAVDGPDDVEAWADAGRERYGKSGDVIVYHPGNRTDQTPIIHRAMAWVAVQGGPGADAREYHVRWSPENACPESASRSADGGHCVWDARGITVPEFGVTNYKPAASGFITKGDNPFSNPRADQVTNLSPIVEPAWIEGKSRGEIPWLGLIKLALSPAPNEGNPPEPWMEIGKASAPQDLWVMLGVSLFVLIGLPVGYDGWKALNERRTREEEERVAAEAAGAPGTDAGTAPAPADAAAPVDETPADAEPVEDETRE